MDIESENELKDIVQNVFAKTLKTSFIIEKQFEGKEYRVFLTKEGNKSSYLCVCVINQLSDGICLSFCLLCSSSLSC